MTAPGNIYGMDVFKFPTEKHNRFPPLPWGGRVAAAPRIREYENIYKLAVVLRTHLRRLCPRWFHVKPNILFHLSRLWLAEIAFTRADVALRTR